MTRRSHPQLEAAALDALVVALDSLDIAVADVEGVNQQPRASWPDAVVKVTIDGRPVRLAVESKAYGTGSAARELIADRPAAPQGTVPMLVAERVTAEARQVLEDAGWSWFDRRGQIRLRAPGLRVDASVPTGTDAPTLRRPRAPVSGRAGITIAYWLCSHPDSALSPTRDAPALRLAPSTISVTVRRLAASGLTDGTGRGLFPELFFELADAWPPEQVWLASAPDPDAGQNADPAASRWVRTGSSVAAAYGAPIVVVEGGPVELYVPGPVDLTLAARRFGSAEPGAGAAVLSVAPASAVVEVPSAGAETPLIGGWPAAPVVAVALDLAQDRARGREILSDWDRPDAIWR
jgi:hypothetical protein